MFVIGKWQLWNRLSAEPPLSIFTISRESEDTMLFLMKEIYSSMGVQSDSQIPQQSMTIERPRVVSPAPTGSAAAVNFNLYPQQPTTSGTVTGMPGATGR